MKTCTIVLLLAALPALASAESYVCVVDHATGFSFNSAHKTWQPSRFPASKKYLVKPNTDQKIQGEWIVRDITFDILFASCGDFNKIGALRCDGTYGEFAMNRKSLRFIQTFVVGYWNDAIPGEQDGNLVEGENTPHIAIGRCSVLEP